MNQNRKNHPFLRRALTAVLTLLMLVNVCFPAMQAHATEETLENYLQFDMAITNAKAAANALDPQSETFQQDAQAVSATLTDLTAKVEAIVTTEAGGTSNISDDNVVTLKAMLSGAAATVDAKSAENAAYLAKQSQPPVTPAPSDNTSNVGGNEPEKDKTTAPSDTTAPADNTSNVGGDDSGLKDNAPADDEQKPDNGALEDDVPVCSCTPVNGMHAETCALYEEPEVDTAAVDALFLKLMSYDSYEALDDYMSNDMTEDEYVLMGYFSDEQNEALNAHIRSLSDNGNVVYEDSDFQQGSVKTVTVENADQYDYRIRQGNRTVTDSGIEVKVNGDEVTISVSETTEPGEYTIQFGTWGYFFVPYFEEYTSISVTVTEASSEGSGTTTGPVVEKKKMTYDKTATANGDGTYNLELTLSGSVGSQTNKALVDVVFIVDNSNSMYPDDSTYMQQLKPVMRNFVTELDSNENIDAQYAVVLYGTRAELRQGFNVGSTTKATINNISNYTYYEGGTNYQAGIYKGKQALNSKRTGATTVVIFLSDGLPTYRGVDSINGTGGSDKDGLNIAAAVQEVGGLNCNYFYCIGIGSSYGNNLTTLMNASPATYKQVFPASNGNTTDAFNNISAAVTTFLCENVTITDTLNHVDNELMVKVTNPSTVMVTVYNGDTKVAGPAQSVNLSKTDNNDAATLTASYNEATHVLTLDFPDDYQLEPDYTYKLSAVIEPTEKAYQEYRENGGYTDAGDANTGTHSGAAGFYANDGATVSYTYNGVVGTATYARPVIQLDPGTLVITKSFDGMEPENVPNLKFPVTLTFPGAEPQTVDVPFSQFKEEAESEGVYRFEIAGLSPNTEYSVTEQNFNVEGYNVTTTITGADNAEGVVGSGTVAKGATETVAFNNSYELANTSFSVTKKVSGNMGSYNDSFNFSMTIKDKNNKNVILKQEELNGLGYSCKVDQNGVITFVLKHNETIAFTELIPIDSVVTVTETDQSAKYKTYLKDPTDEGNKGQSEVKEYVSSKLTSDGGSVTFYNHYEATIETGITRTSFPFILLLSTAIVFAMILLLDKARYGKKF